MKNKNAVKQLDKTVEKYHYMQVQHVPVDWIEILHDMNVLRRILTEEDER